MVIYIGILSGRVRPTSVSLLLIPLLLPVSMTRQLREGCTYLGLWLVCHNREAREDEATLLHLSDWEAEVQSGSGANLDSPSPGAVLHIHQLGTFVQMILGSPKTAGWGPSVQTQEGTRDGRFTFRL